MIEKSAQSYEDFVKETKAEIEKKLAKGEITKEQHDAGMKALGLGK